MELFAIENNENSKLCSNCNNCCCENMGCHLSPLDLKEDLNL